MGKPAAFGCFCLLFGIVNYLDIGELVIFYWLGLVIDMGVKCNMHIYV